METKPPQQGEGAFKALRVTRYLILLILLGLGVHLILPQIASLKHSIQVIKDMIFWVVGLAMIAQVASYLGSGYLLKALVHLSGSSLSISKGAMIALASASFGMVAGGMVGSSAATYRWMQKKGINPEAATLAGTIPGLFYDIVLICVTLVGLIHLLAVHQLSRIQGISFGLILLFLIGLIGLLVWGQRRRENLMALAEKVSYRWAQFSHQTYQPQEDQRLAGWLVRRSEFNPEGRVAWAFAGSCAECGIRYVDHLPPVYRGETPCQPGCFADWLWASLADGQNGFYDTWRCRGGRKYHDSAIYQPGRTVFSSGGGCAGVSHSILLVAADSGISVDLNS